MNNNSLIDLMLEKSQESFLLAIEVYNKPTIKYRVEGFCFFICNAWEMLFKAYLLKNKIDIYYKTNKSNQNRTISITDAMRKILTNEKDPLRKNLEVVIGIRNMASHLVIPEYATLLNDVFMACTKNYTIKLKQYFNISIDEKMQSDYLTMFIPREVSKIDIEGKYGKEVFKKYIDTKTFLSHSFAENANDKNVVNESFALSYELSFKTVSDINAADFTMAKVAPGKSQIGVIKVQEPIDPNKTHPLTCRQVIEDVNKELALKRITFTPISDKAKTSFTASTFNSLNKILKFKEDAVFTYKHRVGKNVSCTYSTKLVQKIINTFIDNPDILRSIKKC